MPPLSTSNAVRQLSDGNTVGTILGQSSTDLIGFYGAAAGVAQPAGPQQAAVTRGQACGSICTFATSQSPTSVANVTTTEKGFTVVGATAQWKVATNDLLYVNKPTSQAGLGVGNVRVSAANVVGVTFSNFTAATITPTATETYGVVAIRGLPTFTPTLTPASVAANTTAEQLFTVAGLRAGSTSLVQVMKPTAQAGLDIVGMRVSANNQLGITFANVTAAVITPTAGEVYTVFDLAGLDAVNNELVFQTTQSPTSVANATSAEQGFTINDLLATDIVKGVSKPTAQAGLGIVGYRTSAVSTAGVTFGNFTAATITPTASEVYEVSAHRTNPVAPLLVYSQTLSPSSVAANTTAEQTFTVTGLVAGSPVWVNKPTAQPGLGITGVRVSAANTLAINFCNATGAVITPAAEAYTIGNFQLPIDAAGTSVIQSVSLVQQATSILTNGLRSGLTGLNLVAGA